MRKVGLFLVVANVLWMAACGGGGGSSSTSTITSVNVSCSPSTVSSGQNSQCSATVSGTGNFSQGVTWSTTAGTISSTGLLTAPVTSANMVVTVTAISTQDVTKSGSATVTVNPAASGGNVASLIVDSGPPGTSEANIAYVTVQLCVPGTTNCQTIDHVQVDTGSTGMRVLSSVLNLSLPAETDGSGNPINECLLFLDGYVWGTVNTADIYISGEKAGSVPIQVMNSSTVPNSCSAPSGGGTNEGTSPGALGANGLIGIGYFQQDCGQYCVQDGAACAGNQQQCFYYSCPPSGCTPINLALNQQLPNPVMGFSTDNNGTIIEFPSVPDGGSLNPTGSLIFGIGTESNNALNGANIYQIPDVNGQNPGDIITTFNGQSYNQSFIDSGSNALYILDSSITGIPTCSDNNSWYCPSTSPDNLTATNQGQNDSGNGTGSAIQVNFSIENTDDLFQTNNTAWSTLSGPLGPPPTAFDWGLPFFFGRNVFTAIDGANTPGGTGPFVAY